MKTLALTACGALLAGAALAQDAVTLTVTDVRDSQGQVTVLLCPDLTKPVPGPCADGKVGAAPARQGETTVTLSGVRPGAYSVQIVHDANGNGRLDFPAEGYAFGNDAAFPPTPQAASIRVQGPTASRARMLYGPAQPAIPADPMLGFTVGGWVRMGSAGAPAPAGVIKTDVREDGLYGELYAPAGKAGAPVIIVLGGSDGGLMQSSYLAASFTRQGYAVLALAYFAEVGLPRSLSGVPVEYFGKAVAWLKTRPEVDAGRMGAIGTSRGSEAVMLMASRNPEIRAVLAVAPSNLMWPGLPPSGAIEAAWTEGGQPLPFGAYDYERYRPGSLAHLDKAIGDPGPAALPVERVNGPIMLISGEDDQLWASTAMARAIEARLKDRGFRHPVQHLSYPGAGHLVFGGDMSGRTAPPEDAPAAPGPAGMSLGGTPARNFAAAADNWPKVLRFFDEALRVR